MRNCSTRLARHDRVEIAHQRVPVGEHGLSDHIRAGQADCGGLDRLQHRRTGLAHALDRRYVADGRGDGRGKAAEPGQQAVGDRLGVTAQDRQEEYQLQQFVIRQRVGSGRQELGAQARAVLLHACGGGGAGRASCAAWLCGGQLADPVARPLGVRSAVERSEAGLFQAFCRLSRNVSARPGARP